MGLISLLIITPFVPFCLFITHWFVVTLLDVLWYTPKTIYETFNLNWFGTICVYATVFPFSFVCAIGGVIKWLFTVGR